MQTILGDAQTTITCIVPAIGGVASSRTSDYLISMIASDATKGAPSTGTLGLEFAGRAVVSSAYYYVLRVNMPQTSANVFFPIIFFFGDTGLVNTALAVARSIVSAAFGAIEGSGSRNIPGSSKRVSEDCKCKK